MAFHENQTVRSAYIRCLFTKLVTILVNIVNQYTMGVSIGMRFFYFELI